MKKEFSTKPACITETWPGELAMFSWMDCIAAIPTQLMVATTWKSNGIANACLQSWASFVSDESEFVCILGAVNKMGHFYQTLKETGCCVINFPSSEIADKCFKTIECNQFGTDEITASGLTIEKAIKVNAPRIAECFLNLECEYLWEHQNFEKSGNTVVGLKIVHLGIDSARYEHSNLDRYGKTGYISYIYAPRNPETGAIDDVSFGTTETHKK